jgi:hypothetical protein
MGLARASFNTAANKDVNYLATAKFTAEGTPVITTSGDKMMRFEIAGDNGKPQPLLMSHSELLSKHNELKANGDSSCHFFQYAAKALERASGDLPIVGNPTESVYQATKNLIDTRMAEAQKTNNPALTANLNATP